jgi:hypothetical protein
MTDKVGNYTSPINNKDLVKDYSAGMIRFKQKNTCINFTDRYTCLTNNSCGWCNTPNPMCINGTVGGPMNPYLCPNNYRYEYYSNYLGNGPIVHPVNTYQNTFAPPVTSMYPTTAYGSYTPSIYPGQFINTPVISSNQVINYTKVPQIVPFVQRQ